MKVRKARTRSVNKKPAPRRANARVSRLEREVRTLKENYEQLCDNMGFVVPINSLAPEPFRLKRTIHIVVRPSDGEFTALLVDANLAMSGETIDDAVEGLKMTMVDTLDFYEKNESILAPGPARQLAVLRELIERRS